jgi:hypothetical protein
MIVIIFDATQYNASPLGKDIVKKPNISGSIHSIIRLWVCWLGSALSGVTIFCCSHIVPPTRMGIRNSGSGLARSSQRNWLCRGTCENTTDHGV